ncbi:M28 family peptidase [Erythrobacter sp. T5W1-R]|uniref:M20/M25/M40 family metallo-hydrolase n=1 Tax=Erythrobacter sp. T5W1-R TaxID=3101752 RepID=UPI002AFFA5F3|nr:M20/M25/M40 family metallo-hydrolase [Erythrobacter sp. T5W1-R]MEA1619440.1 M28 family peptidase [Erythrobacter sp. T5W1-R]
MSRASGRLLGLAALLLALAGCMRAMPGIVPPAERAAIAARLLNDVTILASDEFGGRKPGTIGEARTLAYLTGRMQEIGLVSGTNDPGSAWRAPVELVSTLPQASRLAFTIGRRTVVIPPEAGFAITPRRRELAQGGPDTGAQVWFAGANPAALSDAQVAGAIIIVTDAKGTDDALRSALFARNAGAVLTVVSDKAALAKLRAQNDEERVRIVNDAANTLSAFMTEAELVRVLGEARWRDLMLASGTGDFVPLALDIGVSIEATSQRREFVSHNLIGMIPGKAPDGAAVLLMAHWDHLGECGPPEAADRICKGAVDNASGLAVMLELSRRLKAGPPLDRDIYVLATTAEETGLLGARAFAASPPIPLDRFVAAFNFDNVAVAPAGAPVGIVGRGRAPFEPLVIEHLTKTKRMLGNRDFADSFLQRQDGWVLLQQGVPAVLVSSAFAGREALGPFLARDYHRPSDTAEQIELGGAIDDLLLHEAVIRQIADPARYQPAPLLAAPAQASPAP